MGLRVLWNAPLHSWTGTASEAVDLLVPLARRVRQLGLVGGWALDFVQELEEKDQAVLYNLRVR